MSATEMMENNKTSATHVDRRQFLITAALAGGSLLLKCGIRPDEAFASAGSDTAKVIPLNAWLKIGTDDSVTIIVSQAEMGQGIRTTLPAVLAEELGADWSRVRLEDSPTDPAYRNPRINWQFTGNSESTPSFFDLMRHMGASAREMLIGAAAQKWKVDAASCRTEAGKVVHKNSRRSARFGDLVEAAAKITPPAKPPLKSEKDWTLLGKSLGRVENPSKIDGSAVFGLDFSLLGLAHAAVRQCPVFGGDLASFDRSSIAGFPGIIDVVRIANGIAVVGETYWQAKSALDALNVTFTEGPAARVSTNSLREDYRRAMEANEWLLVHVEGNPDALHHEYPNVSLAKDTIPPSNTNAPKETYPTIFSQEYESQFLAHATMEPMNCTARVAGDTVEVWAPTQGQEMTRITLASVFNLPKENIQVSRTLLGGGFGRRLVANDFALQAALLAKAVGRPVKVMWSREEDMQHDIYRPATLHRITAGIAPRGRTPPR